MTSNVFSGNKAFYGGAVYNENYLMNVISKLDTFSNNDATDGGAFYKISDRKKEKISILIFD